MTRLFASEISCFAPFGLGTASWLRMLASIPMQLDPKTEVVESSTLDMVFSGDIIHDATTGAVNISGAAFTNVVSGAAFAILNEDGEDKNDIITYWKKCCACSIKS